MDIVIVESDGFNYDIFAYVSYVLCLYFPHYLPNHPHMRPQFLPHSPSLLILPPFIVHVIISKSYHTNRNCTQGRQHVWSAFLTGLAWFTTHTGSLQLHPITCKWYNFILLCEWIQLHCVSKHTIICYFQHILVWLGYFFFSFLLLKLSNKM